MVSKQPRIQCTPRVKRPGREADDSHPSRMSGVVPLLPQYAFVTWMGTTLPVDLPFFCTKLQFADCCESLQGLLGFEQLMTYVMSQVFGIRNWSIVKG